MSNETIASVCDFDDAEFAPLGKGENSKSHIASSGVVIGFLRNDLKLDNRFK